MDHVITGRFRRANFNLLCGDTREIIRSLPDLVLFNAVHNPNHIFCIQAKQPSTTLKFNFLPITFSELAKAVEQACTWIISNVADTHAAKQCEDGSILKSRPVALFMESDVGLFIYLAALLTLNIPCLLLSTRLHPHAVRHLLHESNALSILVSPRMLTNARNALSEKNLEPSFLITASPFESFLASSNEADLGFLGKCAPLVREDDRNVLILHSSGTTGPPKPIRLAHRYLLGYSACHLFPPEDDEYSRGVNLSTLPLYHGFGALAPCLSLSVGKIFCLPPSTTIPTGSMVISLLRSQKFTSLMTVPTILEDISLLQTLDEVISDLVALDFVAVGGGALKPSVAQLLHSKGVNLLNHFGATELGALAPIFRPEKDYDYRYLRLRTDLGLRLERLSTDSMNTQKCKLIGYPFGWGSEFELQDVLECNPIRPDSEVRILGRSDDLLVLATGEKVQPHFIEQALEQNPLVRRAIVFGDGQFEIGVLLEPVSEAIEFPNQFIDHVWPSVIKTNSLVDGHAQISTRSALLIKPAHKIIPLSDKGSPQRREVYAEFEDEIKKVYENIRAEDLSEGVMLLDMEHLQDSLRSIVQACLPEHCKEGIWGDEEDFIHLGMDSLQATRLRRILNTSLRRAGNNKPLPSDFIYSHPSLTLLAQALRGSHEEPASSESLDTTRSLASKYAAFSQSGPPLNQGGPDYGAMEHPPTFARGLGNVVLLTGSTGNLGAHLLELLCKNSEVERVVCLVSMRFLPPKNQSNEALAARQREALGNRGIFLPPTGWSKIELHDWQPGADLLGLGESEYQKLARAVTHIFHGAWPMDFKRRIESFEPHIKAIHDLVKLAQTAHRAWPRVKPKIVLASSIAVVGGICTEKNRVVVPEKSLDDPSSPLPMGYAKAKWVCEKVIESAYRTVGNEIDPMVVRIGQLSGSQTTGIWSTQEHIAALVKASQSVRAMPDLEGTLSWLPVDRAARVIMELLLGPTSRNLVYHVENPVRQSWLDACTVIERKLNLSYRSRLPFDQWLEQVMGTGDLPESLFDFFLHHFLRISGGRLVLATENSRKISPTLRASGAVDNATIELCIESWKSKGFLL